MCLAAPTVTGKGHRKIEPKAKHFSHRKKDQSSRPNRIDNSKRLAKISNHAYKNSEKIQIIFIDNLVHKPTIFESSLNFLCMIGYLCKYLRIISLVWPTIYISFLQWEKCLALGSILWCPFPVIVGAARHVLYCCHRG